MWEADLKNEAAAHGDELIHTESLSASDSRCSEITATLHSFSPGFLYEDEHHFKQAELKQMSYHLQNELYFTQCIGMNG